MAHDTYEKLNLIQKKRIQQVISRANQFGWNLSSYNWSYLCDFAECVARYDHINPGMIDHLPWEHGITAVDRILHDWKKGCQLNSHTRRLYNSSLCICEREFKSVDLADMTPHARYYHYLHVEDILPFLERGCLSPKMYLQQCLKFTSSETHVHDSQYTIRLVTTLRMLYFVKQDCNGSLYHQRSISHDDILGIHDELPVIIFECVEFPFGYIGENINWPWNEVISNLRAMSLYIRFVEDWRIAP